MTQDYSELQSTFDKYNANSADPTFTAAEKVVLDQLKVIQTDIQETNKQIDALNAEIKEKQNKIADVMQQSIFKQGQNQSLLDTLLALVRGK